MLRSRKKGVPKKKKKGEGGCSKVEWATCKISGK